jgi:NTE family protein
MKIWVVSGAGARGAYQASVMADLVAKDGNPDHLIGTSAGALNCAGLSYLGPTGLLDMWRSIRGISDVFCNRYDFWNRDFWLGRYSSAPLYGIIEAAMAGEPKIPFSVVYSDLQAMRMEVVKDPCPSDVLASASIPGVVDPVGGHEVDGGVYAIAPLEPALKILPPDGGEITVILGSNLNPAYSVTWQPRTALNVITRALNAMTDHLMRDDIEEYNLKPNIKLRVIQPPAHWGMGTLDFSPASIKNALALGSEWRKHNGQ